MKKRVATKTDDKIIDFDCLPYEEFKIRAQYKIHDQKIRTCQCRLLIHLSNWITNIGFVKQSVYVVLSGISIIHKNA